MLEAALEEQQHLVEARAKRLRDEKKKLFMQKKLECDRDRRAFESKSKGKSSSGDHQVTRVPSRKSSANNGFS